MTLVMILIVFVIAILFFYSTVNELIAQVDAESVYLEKFRVNILADLKVLDTHILGLDSEVSGINVKLDDIAAVADQAHIRLDRAVQAKKKSKKSSKRV